MLMMTMIEMMIEMVTMPTTMTLTIGSDEKMMGINGDDDAGDANDDG